MNRNIAVNKENVLMKRSAVLAAFALLLLAACGSSGSKFSSTVTSSNPDSSTAPKSPAASEAVTIATRVGCAAPKSGTIDTVLGLPAPVATVQCVAHNVTYKVNVYATHADVQHLFDAKARAASCALGKFAGLKSPYYSVNGDTFVVQALNPGSKPSTFSTGTLAQAKTVGVALKLPVTTVTCPA